jgi:hypothetical protein
MSSSLVASYSKKKSAMEILPKYSKENGEAEK